MRPVRPLLDPAVRRAWRAPDTVQLGGDPNRAVVIAGLDEGCSRLLEVLDGSRDLPMLVESAAAWGTPPHRVGRLIDVLGEAGLLREGAHSPVGVVPRPELARRAGAEVVVRGLDPVGIALVLLLAEAGVGRVVPTDRRREPTRDGTDRPREPTRAGMDEPAAAAVAPARRQDTVLAALAQRFPGTRTAASRNGPPDLVVLARPGVFSATEELQRAGTAHLLLDIREASGVVGPFVLPGRSACRRCQDLHRRDRDPAWPRVAAQLDRAAVGDPALPGAVAALAALHVLTWLDSGGDRRPPSVDGTVEVCLPDGTVRRRTWTPHPACGCRWAA